MKRLIPLILLLGGCTTVQHHPATAAAAPPAPQTACLDPAQIPAEPPMVGNKFNCDARHDLQVLAPNAKALRDWGEQMHAMLMSCAGPVAAPTEP